MGIALLAHRVLPPSASCKSPGICQRCMNRECGSDWDAAAKPFGSQKVSLLCVSLSSRSQRGVPWLRPPRAKHGARSARRLASVWYQSKRTRWPIEGPLSNEERKAKRNVSGDWRSPRTALLAGLANNLLHDLPSDLFIGELATAIHASRIDPGATFVAGTNTRPNVFTVTARAPDLDSHKHALLPPNF